jgi:hypothetical protein
VYNKKNKNINKKTLPNFYWQNELHSVIAIANLWRASKNGEDETYFKKRKRASEKRS